MGDALKPLVHSCDVGSVFLKKVFQGVSWWSFRESTRFALLCLTRLTDFCNERELPFKYAKPFECDIRLWQTK